MSFLKTLKQLSEGGSGDKDSKKGSDNRNDLRRGGLLRGFERLLSAEYADDRSLEQLAVKARGVTWQHFGRVMRMFAPLYLSNECVNNCQYCGFSRDNAILRVTLDAKQVAKEAEHLLSEGHRNILLVAGEHPKFVSNGYVANCIRILKNELGVPSVSLELGPLTTEEYRALVDAGADGLVVYQETYDPVVYSQMHTAGPKKDFASRLECPERAAEAGFRRIGIGALFGLRDWKEEALALAAHAQYLITHHWKAQITVSLPRLRPAAGGFVPRYFLPDRALAQLVCALRITFPEVGIVLSTREPAALRDGLIPLGITMMSAGSHTEPGGYTGQGKDQLHLTIKGKQTALSLEDKKKARCATGQFDISDDRSTAEIAEMLRLKHRLEPVWKDWDVAIWNEAIDK